MSVDTTLDLHSIWDASVQQQLSEVRFGDVLSVIEGSSCVKKIQALALALYKSKINEETQTFLLPLARTIRTWKYFENLDWRSRSSIKIALARLENNPTWLITALECCKSFFRTISFSGVSRQPLAPLLKKEIEEASAQRNERRFDAIPPEPQQTNPIGETGEEKPAWKEYSSGFFHDEPSPLGDSSLENKGFIDFPEPQEEILPYDRGFQDDVDLISNQSSEAIMCPPCEKDEEVMRQESTSEIPGEISFEKLPPSIEAIANTPLDELKYFHDKSFSNISNAEMFFRDDRYSPLQKTRLLGYALQTGRFSIHDMQPIVGAYEIMLARAFSKHVSAILGEAVVNRYLSGILGKSRRVWAKEVRQELRLEIPAYG